eukprot:7083857-Prorocentrum_lima.AAC.1
MDAFPQGKTVQYANKLKDQLSDIINIQPRLKSLEHCLHVDLTGPLVTGLRGQIYILIMAHRLQRGEERILIPWVAPIELKSDAPKEILK